MCQCHDIYIPDGYKVEVHREGPVTQCHDVYEGDDQETDDRKEPAAAK